MSDGHLFRNLLHFGRLLRTAGIETHAGRMLEVAEALTHVELGRRDDFYFTLRTLLVNRPQDGPAFDAAFRLFWRVPRPAGNPNAAPKSEGPRKTAPPPAQVILFFFG